MTQQDGVVRFTCVIEINGWTSIPLFRIADSAPGEGWVEPEIVVEQNNRLVSLVQAQSEMLEKYGRHKDFCGYIRIVDTATGHRVEDGFCDCGYIAALSAIRAQLKEE